MPSASFMSFVPFLLFLSRLLEGQSNIGIQHPVARAAVELRVSLRGEGQNGVQGDVG